MSNKVVTIHQPDFMPWLGLFYKISKSDFFVCLDHPVMDVKNCGWIKRVKLRNHQKDYWVTIPIDRRGGTFQHINQMQINTDERLLEKQKNRILNDYRKAPFFNEIEKSITSYFESKESFIYKRNAKFIKSILYGLDIEIKWLFSSSLDIQNEGNSMNAEITNKVSGNTYLSGTGADEYQNSKPFDDLNITLKVSDFDSNQYSYPQFNNKNDFQPGLSIIDTISNIGFEGTKKLLFQNT